jgi:hypothetical protein
MDFLDVVAFLAWIVRFLGLLVFGVAAGWFSLYAFKQPEGRWQLQIAVFLGLFFLFGLLARFSSAGALGGFALGVGGGLLFWGLKGDRPPEEDTPEEE